MMRVCYYRRMGNREALLAGAKKSLLEKGYDRSTVRDITAAAGGVSMAAIGYHFGSREALLTAALIEAIEEWGAAALPAVSGGHSSAPRSPTPESYRRWWSRMIETFREQRPLWLASIEAFLQAERSPEVRSQLASGNQEARRGLAGWILGEREDDVGDDATRSIGSVQVALISGLMIQWINDPDRAPSAADIVRGLREMVARLE
jgi:AcrR family transcriptional regulator